MAREEHDREDLLAEAKALVERVSLDISGNDEQVVIGFRRDGSASFYFSPQRVYQFTSAGQLRRGFVGDRLFKAQRRQLIALRRERHEQAVELIRHVLDPRETAGFMAEMRSHLNALHHALAEGKFKIVGQVPEGADMIARIGCWLDKFADATEVARSPRAC
ncbi:MAG: hypothetical protein HY288_16895 [Planctomycetia bacterium]|nr:hypothetical protein [Planctomycetia bacterium]